MKILLLGKNGQVGRELQRSLSFLGEVVALDRHSKPSGDLSRLDQLVQTLDLIQPEVIVNAAAYTAVERAEQEQELATLVNATAPACLAQWAAQNGAWFVHYSTDYVFDGRAKGLQRESDPTKPLNSYGKSKLAGEQKIIATGGRYFIFRTSWVYAAHGDNFAKTMLRLAQQHETLRVIDDQWGAPTSAELIADVTGHVLKMAFDQKAIDQKALDQKTIVQAGSDQPPKEQPALAGLYHLTAAGQTSWHGYASYLIENARVAFPELAWRVREVLAVSSQAYEKNRQGISVARPANSGLDTHKLQSAFGIVLPTWQQGVDQLLERMAPALLSP